MSKYYFTFGSAGQLYCGGWIIIHAKSDRDAREKFKKYYGVKGSTREGLMNFAFSYTEPEFQSTDMPTKGNMGEFCWNEIV